MALTLTEGNKYSTTELDRVVIDLLVKDSRVLELLPFEALLGNSLTYDMITTRSGAQFYDVGDVWVESTPTITQDTVVLKRLGGDADIDNFLLETRSNKIDLKSTVLADKVKAAQEKFCDTFWYGTWIDAKGFEGLSELMTSTTYNTTVMAADATGAACTIAKLREMIDLIHGYKPKHMFMTKKMVRVISKYLDSVGQHFQRGVDEFGRSVQKFDALEIVADEHLLDTETTNSSGIPTSETGALKSSIWVLSFAPQAVCGVQGKSGVKTVPVGELETKDANRYRIKWYCGLKYENLRSSSHLTNILSASDMTA